MDINTPLKINNQQQVIMARHFLHRAENRSIRQKTTARPRVQRTCGEGA